MLVSTKGRYALRVMIDLAKHQADGAVPLRDIAQRQEISEKYLEAIIKLLVQGGLVAGSRGKKGGYRLTRLPSEYTAWDIISATENSFYAVECLSPGAAKCGRAAACETLPMWKNFSDTIETFFKKYTLEDLAGSPV